LSGDTDDFELISAMNDQSGGGVIVPCPNNCNNHGVCRSGKCICNTGWTGESCKTEEKEDEKDDEKEKECPNNCSDNGSCNGGKCLCKSGWKGDDCSEKVEE